MPHGLWRTTPKGLKRTWFDGGNMVVTNFAAPQAGCWGAAPHSCSREADQRSIRDSSSCALCKVDFIAMQQNPRCDPADLGDAGRAHAHQHR